MAQSKKAIQRRRNVANQEAIVKLAIGTTIQPIRRTIPGGRGQLISLLKRENAEILEDAIYNWLRGCREYSEVTISFAKEREAFTTQERKLVDFDASQDNPIWFYHAEGKRYLARSLVQAIQQQKAVAYSANKQGVFAHMDSSGTFSPTVTIEQAHIEEWESENPDEEPPWAVGDKVLSDAWQPYIEFMPQNRGQYGGGQA